MRQTKRRRYRVNSSVGLDVGPERALFFNILRTDTYKKGGGGGGIRTHGTLTGTTVFEGAVVHIVYCL